MSEEQSFFERNMEMWERWTNSYMDTMSKTMEQTMEQSNVLRKQVEMMSEKIDQMMEQQD